VVLCSAEQARRRTSKPVWVAASTVATARFDDGVTRGLGGMSPPGGKTYHSEAALAVNKAFEQAGVSPSDLDLVELQDNTVYYELAFPEEWGLCKPGEAERLLEEGETLPTGRLPINPSGGFLSFGEATTAMGVFQVCELGWQMRGEAGARQVPDAKLGLAQTLGLGGNATAVLVKR
jgi:acetyl-CoA acetyltransferase